jgi:hypothetical protein
MRAAVLMAITLATVASCGGNSTSGPLQQQRSLFSSGEFRITVTSGTAATFSWAGGNGTYISVDRYPGSSLQPTWDAFSEIAFPPPIAYGTFPPGGRLQVAPNTVPLQPGGDYLVCVVRADTRAACQEFIP